MKTGVLGGTFNPPHLGHLNAAKTAKAALGLERVLFIPTNIPPHKELPAGTASADDRLNMVRLLIEGKSWAELSDMEVRRGGASYTVDTLRVLHGMGAGELFLIIGTDMLLSFDRVWRAPEEIARLATLAVCAREADDWADLRAKARFLTDNLGAHIELVRGDVLTISSTELREGGDLRRFTTDAVADYIERKHLYGF